MKQLDDGVPKEILSDRVDVSVPVLDKHYDQRSEERKSQRRREVLESSHEQSVMTDGGHSTEDSDPRIVASAAMDSTEDYSGTPK